MRRKSLPFASIYVPYRCVICTGVICYCCAWTCTGVAYSFGPVCTWNPIFCYPQKQRVWPCSDSGPCSSAAYQWRRARWRAFVVMPASPLQEVSYAAKSGHVIRSSRTPWAEYSWICSFWRLGRFLLSSVRQEWRFSCDVYSFIIHIRNKIKCNCSSFSIKYLGKINILCYMFLFVYTNVIQWIIIKSSKQDNRT